jgi:predicted GNAT family acetyltransferase
MGGDDRVRDNPGLSRYEMDVAGGVAFIRYRRKGNVVTLLHAEVPAALRGRGLGSRMTRATLELIRTQGDRVIARCPFVVAYLEGHPEYGDLRADDD